ncbi:transcriptional regulator [Floricoccus tropicus]|uniref:Transcriptional regulator n=1 Tax=Floricoccus tropicus TaxID=1859473 RepID=A0A1E8GMZ4_9LACT|nr:helix-turn-helix transcriptional regulator [Floricoccus tropicus]OFI49634.1 transcriptional regulator [Floricoccus tropicus]
MKNRIKDYRKRMKFSQEDLARLTHVSRQTINAIENDKYDPELALAFKLARFLDVTVDELFDYQNRKKEDDVLWCSKYHCELWEQQSDTGSLA